MAGTQPGWAHPLVVRYEGCACGALVDAASGPNLIGPQTSPLTPRTLHSPIPLLRSPIRHSLRPWRSVDLKSGGEYVRNGES